jgi:methionyl-tRNA formyltransferase
MVTGSAPRIAYFGTPEFAVPTLRRLIDARHRVIAVVSQPDRPRGRGHQLAPTPTKPVALEHGIEVLQPERIRDEQCLERLAALSPDLGVVAAYGKLLPEALLRIPPLGLINVHASLLPRWRGAAPVHRAVIAGDEVTGVTIMRVVKELDAGAMFAAESRPIGPDETSPQVESDLAVMGARLLVDVVDLIASGRATETPQDETRVTLAPKIAKGEGAIDWNRPARALHNLIRGLQPWPLVSAHLEGERILLHASQPTEEIVDRAPGVITRADGDTLAVAAGDRHTLRLLSIQREGRRAISTREFLAGRRIVPGMRLDNG